MNAKRSRVARIVGVGPAAPDGHIRITKGKQYQVVQGSEATHALMNQWCEGIQAKLAAMNKDMKDLSVEEFLRIAREAAPPA